MTSGCNALRRVAAQHGPSRPAASARTLFCSGLDTVGRLCQAWRAGTSSFQWRFSSSCMNDVLKSSRQEETDGHLVSDHVTAEAVSNLQDLTTFKAGPGPAMARRMTPTELELRDPKISKTSIKTAKNRALHLQWKQARLVHEQGVDSKYNWQAVFDRLKTLSVNVPRVSQDHPARNTTEQFAVADWSSELHRLSSSASIADEKYMTSPSTLEGDRDDRNIMPQSVRNERLIPADIFSEDLEAATMSALPDKGLTLEGYETIIVSLLKQGMLPEARQVLRQILQEGPHPKVSTFNIFLHDCAKRKNLKAFNVFLGAMSRSEVIADPETWAAFLEVVASSSAKQVIASEMYQRNLVRGQPIMQLVSRTIVNYSFGPFIDGGNDVKVYIKTLDRLFGLSWTSELAVHRMLHVYGERGRFVDAVQLVDDLSKSRNYIPDVFDLTVLLGHCVSYIAVDTAVSLVRVATDRWNLKFDHKAYDTLFAIFWKARQYNMTRVIWRYACYSDKTTHTMRRLVMHSLMNTDMKPSSTMAVSARWVTSAGSVLVLRSRRRIDKESAQQVLDAERRLWKRAPQHSLAEKLDEANAIDREWATAKVRHTTDTYWKLKNVIRIGHGRLVRQPIEIVRLDVQSARYMAYQRLRRRTILAGRSVSPPLKFDGPRQVLVPNGVPSARPRQVVRRIPTLSHRLDR